MIVRTLNKVNNNRSVSINRDWLENMGAGNDDTIGIELYPDKIVLVKAPQDQKPKSRGPYKKDTESNKEEQT